MSSRNRNSYPGAKPVANVVMNYRPVIAVLAQALLYEQDDDGKSYIAASYVKLLESAGARVVPVPATFDVSKIKELFSYVNGLLIPGGSAKLLTSTYYKNAKIFYELATQAYLMGDYFPIWGTCRGCETLVVITAGTMDVLTSCDAKDVALPLNFTSESRNSRLFRNMSPSLYKTIAKENVTYHLHKFGFKSDVFHSNMELRKFYKVLATNVDKSGEEFVSTIESRRYPIYGVIWHPEKINYEFKNIKHRNIPHTMSAIQTTQYMANFFVNEARQSKHSFPSNDVEEEYLIYRHTPIRPDNSLPSLKNIYEQVYMFP